MYFAKRILNVISEESKLLSKFLKYISHSVAAMVGLSVYILADTFFISVHSGANGLAVLNLILPIYGLIYAIGSMIGIGSATRYSIRKARGKDVSYFFMEAILWSVLISIPFVLVGIYIPDSVLTVLGADKNLVELGKNYTRIILVASPFFMANYTFTAFARNDNAPSTAMVGSISGSLFNVVFDYVFMFPMNLGFMGAALATAISPIVTMSICTAHYLGKNNQVQFKIKKLSIKHLVSCCQLGISAFVSEISNAVITIVFNMLLLNISGNIGVASYGVIANLALVAVAIFNGLAQGSQPLISQCYGKSEGDNIKRLLSWSVKTCLIVENAIILISWIFTDALIAIFNSENNLRLLNLAHNGLRLYFLGFIFAGINVMLVSYFSAIDRAAVAIVGSLMRGFVAIIILAIVLANMFGENGVWISFLGSEIITFITIILTDTLQKKKKTGVSL